MPVKPPTSNIGAEVTSIQNELEDLRQRASSYAQECRASSQSSKCSRDLADQGATLTRSVNNVAHRIDSLSIPSHLGSKEGLRGAITAVRTHLSAVPNQTFPAGTGASKHTSVHNVSSDANSANNVNNDSTGCNSTCRFYPVDDMDDRMLESALNTALDGEREMGRALEFKPKEHSA